MTRILAKSILLDATASWLAEGRRVAGPRQVRPDLLHYGWLTRASELTTDGVTKPANSIKSMVLPRHETLYAYQGQGRQVELVPLQLPAEPQILLAARPCDAAALPILDHVFNWDYRDAAFNRRRELTTVVTLACRQHDAFCFCTSVGLAPDSTRGADALLVPLDDDSFEVRFVTEKGAALLEPWTSRSDRVGTVGPGPEPRFQASEIHQLLSHSPHDLPWTHATLSCLGCGACAHNCPTCHCFDIVDQPQRRGGRRARNWDSCQHVMYSLHASGHNPRPLQAARQRNRIMHKFQTYPDKFGEILCTGCGTCGRNCPVGLGVRRVLHEITDLAEA